MNYIHVYLYMEYESVLLESHHMNRIRSFQIISIPSKTVYFRLPNHVILMEC
jgi:hypothetical protein